MEIKIEKLTNENINLCILLFIDVFNKSPWNDKWTEDKAKSLFNDFIRTPGFIGFVGFQNNQLISVCIGHIKTWWNSSEYYIEEYFISSEKQNMGIGTLFLQEIEKQVMKKGIKKINLLTARNTPAEGFYLKNGFTNLDYMTFMKKNL